MVNNAYNTLRKPHLRAQYLLELQGIDISKEGQSLTDSELLMEVMEVRENIENAQNIEALHQIRRANQQRIHSTLQDLEQAFDNYDYQKAKQRTIELQYWTKASQEIEIKEEMLRNR